MGIASRRKADEMVVQGKVMVNRKKATLGMMVDSSDEVIVDGRSQVTENLVYIMLNKPVGVVSTVVDDQNRKTVVELVEIKERIYPVGRLDTDSEGLVLLTNDGELAYRLTHPKFQVSKEYEVKVEGPITNNAITQLRKGVRVEGKKTLPAVVERMGEGKLRFIIREGRNRQVRKMCKAVNLEVISLKRVAMGGLRLWDLGVGEWRELTGREIQKLSPWAEALEDSF